MAEAAGGLSREKQVSVGRRYKAGTINAKAKNDSVFTGRDSLFQAMRRALANFRSGYNIPRAPLPPKNVTITSGGDRISLSWDLEDPNDPNLDSIRIYRTKGRYNADTVALLQTLDKSARSYDDRSAVRGFEYFYHLVAVGKSSANTGGGGTPPGVPLLSTRIATQTYDPAFLLTEAGPPLSGNVAANLSKVRIVPNPFVSGGKTFGGSLENSVKFFGIPGYCTIKIYTELGELIKEIAHTNGSGSEPWNMTTSSNQIIVSGVYIAVIEDTQAGGKTIQKFVVIR
jgi:hypothetical protein